MPRRILAQSYAPILEPIRLCHQSLQLLADAQAELTERAAAADGCWGLFSDQDDLPASRQLAASMPEQPFFTRQHQFSWLRLSLGRPATAPNYHLDADSGTGVGSGKAGSRLLPRRRIWRLLVNLHDSEERQVAFLNVAPDSLALTRRGGAIGLAEHEEVDGFEEQLLRIPPREAAHCWAAYLCVTRVLHAGYETPAGHFLGSWTYQEPA